MGTDQSPLSAPIPERISVDHRPEGLVLSFRWFSETYMAMAAFAFIWDGFLVFWYSFAFTQNAPWIMFVFPLLHVSVGIGITYIALAGFYNKTTITVGLGNLSIRHSPLPWPGNRIVPASELVQLYSESRVIYSNNGARTTYQLSAISNQNRKIKLLSGLNSQDEVRFFEHKIEEQLGIQDRPVEGEIPR
ncbi:MAG TPA: hypothetical protein VMH23_01520 [Bacteroidota bacterium]|nr:hypothetical protein [Bacteroidota bacterium]